MDVARKIGISGRDIPQIRRPAFGERLGDAESAEILERKKRAFVQQSALKIEEVVLRSGLWRISKGLLASASRQTLIVAEAIADDFVQAIEASRLGDAFDEKRGRLVARARAEKRSRPFRGF
jgi:hypothetical protein